MGERDGAEAVTTGLQGGVMADRILTDADVAAIVAAMQAQEGHCRYDVAPADLGEAVRFFKAFNEALQDSKRTVRNALLKLFVAGICVLIGLGIIAKLKGG